MAEPKKGLSDFADSKSIVRTGTFSKAVDLLMKALHDDRHAINELTQRVADLEGQVSKSMRWRGVWKQDAAYGVGEIVTHKGAWWLCKSPTCSRPGDDPDAWKLTVKSYEAR